MIGTKEKKDIVKRLHYIKGQLGGIEKMLDDGRPVKDVYGQLKAVEQALHKAIHVVLDGQLKKQFAETLAQRLAACPGDCDDAARLQFLRREFAKLDLKKLIDELTWLANAVRSPKPQRLKPSKEVKPK
jgi:DNA-binding FrmR family transcriptional regulator